MTLNTAATAMNGASRQGALRARRARSKAEAWSAPYAAKETAGPVAACRRVVTANKTLKQVSRMK